jgi:hypothetical protein
LDHDGVTALYPGPSDANAVEVTADDLRRLQPEEFLNDTVIDVWLKKMTLELVWHLSIPISLPFPSRNTKMCLVAPCHSRATTNAKCRAPPT